MTGGFDPRRGVPTNPQPNWNRPPGQPAQSAGYPKQPIPPQSMPYSQMGNNQSPPYNHPPQYPGGGAYNQPPRGPEKNRRGRWIALGATAAAGVVALSVGVGVLTGGGENGNHDAANSTAGNRTTSERFELLTGDACENVPNQAYEPGGFHVSDEVRSRPEVSDDDILDSFKMYDGSATLDNGGTVRVDIRIDSLSDEQRAQLIAVGRDKITRYTNSIEDQSGQTIPPGQALQGGVLAYSPNSTNEIDTSLWGDGEIDSPDIRFCAP